MYFLILCPKTIGLYKAGLTKKNHFWASLGQHTPCQEITMFSQIYLHCACMPACLYGCMPACLYACMYVCLPACLYACMPACLYACMPVCLHACMPAALHGCIAACLYACMAVCLHACMPACLHVWLGLWQVAKLDQFLLQALYNIGHPMAMSPKPWFGLVWARCPNLTNSFYKPFITFAIPCPSPQNLGLAWFGPGDQTWPIPFTSPL